MIAPQNIEDLYLQLANDARRIIGMSVSGEMKSVERIPFGVMTHKFAVHLAHGPSYVVRFYPPARSFVVEYEPDVLRRCGEADIPVPEAVCDSRTGPSATLAYLAYRMVPGINLEQRLALLEPSGRKEIARRVMECARKMKDIQMEGFGEPRDGFHAQEPSWRSFVEKSFHEGLAAVQRGKLLRGDVVARLVDLGRRLEKFSQSGTSGLIWGDVRPQNILLDGHDRFACLLDFEGVLAGDPLMTLGYGHAALGDHPFFRDCVDCWPDVIDWELLYFYSVLRLLRLAKYAHLPLPTGHARTALADWLPGFQTALSAL